MLGQGCKRGYQAGNHSSGLLGAREGPSELRAEGTDANDPFTDSPCQRSKTWCCPRQRGRGDRAGIKDGIHVSNLGNHLNWVVGGKGQVRGRQWGK